MGICWSEPPQPPVMTSQAPVYPVNQPCRGCGSWAKQPTIDFCESCLQKNRMKYMGPTAPPAQLPYTYAVPYQQPQMYSYYNSVPIQQRQIGTGTAMVAGFVAGAVLEDIMDPI